MIKKALKLLVITLIIIGIFYGISITIKRTTPELKQKEIDEKIFGSFQTRNAEITKFYIYGKSLDIAGKISNINKDNFESVKLVISDGEEYEKQYKLSSKFEEKELYFFSDEDINKKIVIDELDNKEYYIFLRIKLNNSIEPRFYSFSNISEFENIEYYTITKEEKNKKVNIEFKSKTYNEKEFSYMSIALQESVLPEEVYDIVIDAGHGGTDSGERLGADTEADITLEYAKKLKENLEANGYKVKLTRDDENTDRYDYTNMYDSAGRITSACKSRAKLMISFHINNGYDNLNGFEIYAPCKSNLDFAQSMSSKIKEYTNMQYSNNNSFKKFDGVYVRNFTANVIKDFENTANKKGYEPYNITTDTPYLYTIREVGGIATNAYVDGRNKDYSANAYYNVNYGIECYQIELGYIKNDLEKIKNEKDAYIRAITESIVNNY